MLCLAVLCCTAGACAARVGRYRGCCTRSGEYIYNRRRHAGRRPPSLCAAVLAARSLPPVLYAWMHPSAAAPSAAASSSARSASRKCALARQPLVSRSHDRVGRPWHQHQHQHQIDQASHSQGGDASRHQAGISAGVVRPPQSVALAVVPQPARPPSRIPWCDPVVRTPAGGRACLNAAGRGARAARAPRHLKGRGERRHRAAQGREPGAHAGGDQGEEDMHA